jgi:hypothetical protein
MQLLKIDAGGDFNLDELNSGATQPYAILLHVWGKNDEEVTFRDLVDNTGKQKVGYDKIDFCAKQAKEDGIEYFWVDTCCINKLSSAELSEAKLNVPLVRGCNDMLRLPVGRILC